MFGEIASKPQATSHGQKPAETNSDTLTAVSPPPISLPIPLVTRLSRKSAPKWPRNPFVIRSPALSSIQPQHAIAAIPQASSKPCTS
ncbi:hypothetical protein, partial [Brevibacillus agri]|uniref:hypothetical protein n=1 Tax=Brevibacillus agri TaxID=51101 RepID=UPI003D1A917E